MFSRRLFIFVSIILFIAINYIVISMSTRDSIPLQSIEKVFITISSPAQKAVSSTINFTKEIWSTYFLSVLAVKENAELRKKLGEAENISNRYEELLRENARLKRFVKFTENNPDAYVAAQVISRDPSPWFKTLMIDKGSDNGLVKGSPVLVSEGIVGKIVKVSDSYSKVLLIIDRNSAVDALVQNSRVRGIVKGNNSDTCSFVYALRKDDIREDELIVSSGLDRVFPKGLKIGRISRVRKAHSQLFQDITITTSVDFDKLEEVLVIKK